MRFGGRSGIPLLLSLKFTMLSSFVFLCVMFAYCLFHKYAVSSMEREHACCVQYYMTDPYHSFWHTARRDK